MFWSDVLYQGWGATACDQVASGRWDVNEVGLSINVKELLAIEKGLHVFLSFLKSQSVVVFSDNTTALNYSAPRGHSVAKVESGCSAPSSLGRIQEIVLHPQFVMGKCNVVADSLSWPSQIVRSERMLHPQVFVSLQKRWSVTVDLFATSLNHCLPVYFALMSDSMAAGTDAMLRS